MSASKSTSSQRYHAKYNPLGQKAKRLARHKRRTARKRADPRTGQLRATRRHMSSAL